MPKDKKPRAKKDPNAPKKALSAFMIFSTQNRTRVKDENPSATFGILLLLYYSLQSHYSLTLLLIGDMGKLLGAEWKEMSDADKKVFSISIRVLVLYLISNI